MKRVFGSSGPARIALAVLIVLLGAAGMVFATLQNALVIMAPTPSASVANPDQSFQSEFARTQSYADKLVGKTEAVATQLALKHGFLVRTIARDDQEIAVTADLRSGRIQLEVKHNIVVKATAG